MSWREEEVTRVMAADAHSRGHPRPKRYAALMGYTTVRTAQKHRSPEYTEGSPMHRALQATMAADDPWIMAAHLMIAAERMSVKERTKEELIARYRELLAEDARHEGLDNALKVCRETTWEERAIVSARDMAHDMEKAAIEQEFAVRGVPLSEVMGS